MSARSGPTLLGQVGQRVGAFDELSQSFPHRWFHKEPSKYFHLAFHLVLGKDLDESFGGDPRGCIEFVDLAGCGSGDF
jgi:hypothetical protein